MSDGSRALITIKVFAHQGMATFEAVIRDLQRVYKIERLSSVYRAKTQDEGIFSLRRNFQNEVTDGLVAAATFDTIDSAGVIVRNLKSLEALHQKEVARRTVSLNLLALDQEIIMLPEISIPHPEFHLRPEELVPAQQVWPEYFHPVLQMTIQEIVEKEQPVEWGEFYAQGEPLLRNQNSDKQFKESP